MGVPPNEVKGSLGKVIKLEIKRFLESPLSAPVQKKFEKDLKHVLHLFLECVYIHHDEAPKDLAGAELKKIALETLPRRFSGEEDFLPSVPDIVKGYFDYLRNETRLQDPEGVEDALSEMKKNFTRTAKKIKAEDRITREEAVGQIRCDDKKVGRNDPCPCGSGKKFKKCCQASKGA